MRTVLLSIRPGSARSSGAPLPGLSPVSGDLVLLAAALGTEYRDLVARILDAACRRRQLPTAQPLGALA